MKRDIGVAGAGIGGLAFAAAAARAGNRVVVFDRFDTPAPVGSGLVIQPVGQAVLDAVGAGDAAQAQGQPITRMLGHEARSGRAVLDVTYDLTGSGRHGLGIHRGALFASLLATATDAGAELRAGHTVTAQAGGRVKLSGKPDAGPFDLIVDATGAGSALSPLAARPLSYGALWANVPWPETALAPDHLSQRYRGARHMIGALPIGRLPGAGQPLAAVFWSLPADGYDAWRARPLADWKAQATALWPAIAPFLATIAAHDDMTMARYGHGTLARPAGAGIAHIGDAAHRTSPQLGQGANMALLDACALAAALAQHHHLPDALKAYVLGRRWHVRAYQLMSAAFTPQYQSDSRFLPLVRDHLLMPLSQMPPVPRILGRLVCGDLLPPYGSLGRRAAAPEQTLQRPAHDARDRGAAQRVKG